VSGNTLDAWVRLVAPDALADPRGFAAVAHSHPRWVVDQLAAALGDRADELEALLRSDNTAPRVTLVARPGLSDPAELLAAGGTPSAYSPVGVTLDGGDPSAVAAVAEGRAGVQDEGSQLMALTLAAAPLAGEDTRWLDVCAGPGGKAALLGACVAGKGGRLLAAERQPHRADLVRQAARRLTGAVEVVCADGTVPAWRPGSFDRVLVDAPCTGLGALRRRPESRWRRAPDDLATLVPLQERLLSSALDAARPGGVVAYVTCSPVLAETRGVVEAVLGARPDARLLDATAALADATLRPGVPAGRTAVPDAKGPLPGTVQLWPHRHGTDAMFLALLTR
jgi:16S rRNA (cytosine967-C5)-methyltransferase